MRIPGGTKREFVKGRPLLPCFVLALAVLALLVGCAKKIPHDLTADYADRRVRLVAVMPIIDKANNPEVNNLLRRRVVDALYFKGYPKIPLNVVDEKLAAFFKDAQRPTLEAMPPKDAGAVLGVDAVLYSTLEDCRTSYLFLYAPTSVAVSFQLYSVRTGERLWQTKHRINERIFDVTPSRVRMKSCQIFEPALDEIVSKAMDTLPDGPDL